jgi:hypothetical protein
VYWSVREIKQFNTETKARREKAHFAEAAAKKAEHEKNAALFKAEATESCHA